MKKNFLLMVALVMLSFGLNAQTLLELKSDKAEVAKMIGDKKAELATLQGRATSLQDQIDKLSGWMYGFGGNLGFDFNKASNWVAAPNSNATASSLALGFNGFANKINDKYMWRNTLTAAKAYQDIDYKGEVDATGKAIKDGLFDAKNGTIDNINLSSLAGYRIHPQFMLSALGEGNTSFSNFFDPGTLDIGIGGTWTPNDNLVVIIHPLNYNFLFNKSAGLSGGQTALGAKIRAEYNNKFNLVGKAIGVSSVFTSFLPYSGDKTTFKGDKLADGTVPEWQATPAYYQWMNNFTFNLFNGIGANVGLGFRRANSEINDKTQTLTSIGLGYTF